MKRALVTGSCGLVGSSVTRRLLREGWKVYGLDNNSRFAYFGIEGDVRPMLWELNKLKNYVHLSCDLRERRQLQVMLSPLKLDLVVHAAAQPSHDLAARIPFVDFEVNAYGTLVLLELTRTLWKEAPFVFLSTNKVYGDGPNRLGYYQSEWRFDFLPTCDGDDGPHPGISETFPVDQNLHSLFGCSKLGADLYVQEYGRYYGLPTVCLRCGCLTGEDHAGTELHGFLAYLVRVARERRLYTVYGYGGRQVRDNLHADDVADFVLRFAGDPCPARVYNLGGGRDHSCSILEALQVVEELRGWRPERVVFDPTPRRGDHRVYYSNLSLIQRDYGWEPKISLRQIMERLCHASS